MLYETGVVAELVNDIAIVRTQNQLACSSCKVVDTCGNGIVEKYLSGKVFTSEIKNELNAKVGDRVTLAIPNSSVTRASIVVYLIPLMGFLLSAISASYFFQSENKVIVLSLCGLALGFFATKFYNRYLLKTELYSPKMVLIADNRMSDNTRSETLKSGSAIDVNQI